MVEALRDSMWEELVERRKTIDERQKHMEGTGLRYPAFGSNESALFREFQRTARTNYLRNVVTANANRLVIHSIKDLATGRHDEETWALWQRAQISADAHAATQAALGLGWGHIQILPHPRRPNSISVQSLSPAWCIARPYVDDAAENEAALVVSHRRDKHVEVLLYQDGGAFDRWVSTKPVDQPEYFEPKMLGPAESGYTTLSKVPVIELGDGTSVMEPGVQHQNRANQTLLHLMANERHASFPHVFFLNAQLQRDEDGNPVPPTLPSSPDVPAVLEGENLKMASTPVVNATDLRKTYTDTMKALAAACSTPAHHVFPGDPQSTSADLVEITEQVYIAQLRVTSIVLGEKWITGLQLMREAAGLPEKELRVIYDTSLPQRWHLAMDGYIKAVQAGFPIADALVRSGAMTPADALRAEAHIERKQDLAALQQLIGSGEGGAAAPDVETIVADGAQ